MVTKVHRAPAPAAPSAKRDAQIEELMTLIRRLAEDAEKAAAVETAQTAPRPHLPCEIGACPMLHRVRRPGLAERVIMAWEHRLELKREELRAEEYNQDRLRNSILTMMEPIFVAVARKVRDAMGIGDDRRAKPGPEPEPEYVFDEQPGRYVVIFPGDEKGWQCTICGPIETATDLICYSNQYQTAGRILSFPKASPGLHGWKSSWENGNVTVIVPKATS